MKTENDVQKKTDWRRLARLESAVCVVYDVLTEIACARLAETPPRTTPGRAEFDIHVGCEALRELRDAMREEAGVE